MVLLAMVNLRRCQTASGDVSIQDLTPSLVLEGAGLGGLDHAAQVVVVVVGDGLARDGEPEAMPNSEW